MLQIELVLDLSHCIETMAKRQYEGTLKQLLATAAANKELEEKAEILRLFLQTANFKTLRAESEKFLIKGKVVKFVIYSEEEASKYVMRVLSNSQD
jgi:hypothetical protein